MARRAGRRDQAWNPPSGSGDVSALFALLAAGPFLLPLIADLRDLVFLIPMVACGLASVGAVTASRRDPGVCTAWRALGVSLALASLASAVAVVVLVTGAAATAGLYLGLAASLALLAAVGALARRSLSGVRLDGLTDAMLVGLLLAAVGVYFVVIPGSLRGDPVLTVVFLVDLVALMLATVSLFARGNRSHRRQGWWILGGCAALATGDGLVAASSAGVVSADIAIAALLWTVGAIGLATAAGSAPVRYDEEPSVELRRHVMIGRILTPVVVVLGFPLLALAVALAEGLTAWDAVYFGIFFLVALVVAFARQAYLLADNERVMVRERRLRRQAVRRTGELEALTGLATTMTQTLEEAPIVESGLGVLSLGARATSSALHVVEDGVTRLRASTGEWQSEHPWARSPGSMEEAVRVDLRGRREVLHLRLATRGQEIGVVTLMRPDSDPFQEDELTLVRLLIDQLAIAVQNARDYREKLELATRDSLTGLYNRRFFQEALEKELQRSERYGSSASLVVLDIDDFKAINDRHGHGVGDDVLRAIGRLVEGLIRPVDTFARIGGEEFGLLVPETRQLDALLVAERVRATIARNTLVLGERVTVSVGVSSCPQDAADRQDLEQRADAALYWAKRNGKNICAVASEVVGGDGRAENEGALAHLYGLVSTIDRQHFHTRDHSENVAAYSVALAQRLGLDRDHIVRLRRAALLHDIGKVAVSGDILVKPARLDDAELEEMGRHPAIGGRMLCHAGLSEEAEWVANHHERVDGGGYPSGRAGDDIPVEARIIFVADSFEAMTSDRPYRRGMPVEDAVRELGRCAGTQFEPEIVEAMVELVTSGELTVLALRDEDMHVPAR